MTSLNCPDFINIALETLEMEEMKAEEHMAPDTKIKLAQKLNQIIVKENAEIIINKPGTGCKEMLKNKKSSQLQKMYNLFCREKTTLKYMIMNMSPYIEERGNELISNKDFLKDPIKFTEKLLELKKEMDDIVEN